MESLRDMAKFYIHFESCCLKIKINKLKSDTLRCDGFVYMVLKKFKNLNDRIDLLPVENYGLFESCNGIEMLIPDSRLILQMDNLLENKNHFFIRKKNFFELNQNNELTDSIRSKILSFYRNANRKQPKKSLKLVKSNFMSFKTVQKQIKTKNYIKKTQIFRVKLVENGKERCCVEEKSTKLFLIKKNTKF